MFHDGGRENLFLQKKKKKDKTFLGRYGEGGRCVCKWLLQQLVHFSFFFPEPRNPRVPSSVSPEEKGKSGLASCAHNLVGKRGVCSVPNLLLLLPFVCSGTKGPPISGCGGGGGKRGGEKGLVVMHQHGFRHFLG